ncbi:hypothetical protein P691DRAFT_702021 [Macrolepiota fuliginosa MF-IS2]|uniref:DUF4238 domain-containing protein n=1 Tax=Macrolepiota fuliginosa MF-IS2 TaxID=1400762 RepID=A0A9P6C682_9AGAR|nr:hypothetical protein P691DRAFT_702021 [Macrolepiota fuliginosa MF-IS2]
MPPNTQAKSGPKTQYQHYIPRFILRKFLEEQGPARTSKQRSKDNWKAKKIGVETELINVYDLPTKSFQSVSISKSFGGVNIYTDIGNGINSQHVEGKLSRLENEAAQVITAIQDARGQGTFVLTRHSLEILRKFVYIMHFRKPIIQDMYFNTGPEDPLRDWIQRYKQIHNLQTPEDMWLHSLAYILETPHPMLVAKGEEIRSRYGEQKFWEMLQTKVDPELDNWFAQDYSSLANAYYFGVWEAASGCEFITGNNSFGLWEGIQKIGADIHRLHVISPRLILVLRSITFRMFEDEASKFVHKSALAEIPLPGAETKYHGHPGGFTSEKALSHYRSTPAAQKDIFTYKITKLTAAQTREVNEVILVNVRDEDGSIVFLSKEYMLGAVHNHIASPEIPIQHTDPHGRYSPLYHALLRSLTTNSTSASDADYRLRVVREVLRRRMVQFRSDWDEAYLCYRIATADANQLHPLAVDVRLRLAQMIIVTQANLKIQNPRRNPSARIVDSMSQEDSTHIMGLASRTIRILTGLGPTKKRTDEAFVKGTALVGYIEWLAKERMDFFKEMIGPAAYQRLTLI